MDDLYCNLRPYIASPWQRGHALMHALGFTLTLGAHFASKILDEWLSTELSSIAACMKTGCGLEPGQEMKKVQGRPNPSSKRVCSDPDEGCTCNKKKQRGTTKKKLLQLVRQGTPDYPNLN
eukprot:1159344-Pelagomonas_calceolata.AAC.19